MAVVDAVTVGVAEVLTVSVMVAVPDALTVVVAVGVVVTADDACSAFCVPSQYPTPPNTAAEIRIAKIIGTALFIFSPR